MTDATAGGVGAAEAERDIGPYPPTEAMLARPVDPEWQEASETRLKAVWKGPEGIRYWSDVNNSSVGVWYSLTAFA
jgi:cytochrome c oxidase subunit 1/cytochrome c oxidase subunit I+III